jgi:hypothetical protein
MKKLILVYKKTTSNEFINFWNPNYNNLLNIIFLCIRKTGFLKKCIISFLTNTVTFVVDFAKDYSFEVQNKVQNMH